MRVHLDTDLGGNTALIRRRFEEWGSAPHIVGEVFGDADPGHIAATVDRFCERSLGARVARPEFFEASVGTVLGLELRDGRRIVVKVHRPDTSVAFLDAVQTVQRTLAADGFPCPAPLVGPTPLEGGVAVVETLLDRGEPAHARDPAVRRAMAEELARLVRLCRGLTHLDGLRQGIMARREGELWPTPHDRRFDFEGTAAGAEWIDRIAVQARRARDETAGGEVVVGHGDWREQHLRFDHGRLSAVYDWDSLTIDREPVLIGSVAHAFTANWDFPERHQLPELGEALAFANEYEAARGAPFSSPEQRVLRASLTYTMAYTARCEHSDHVTGLDESGAGEAPPPGTARAFLAAHADELLA